MPNDEERLLALREQINESKTKLNQVEGKIETYLEQLKEFGCSSLHEAKKKLAQLDTEITDNEKQLTARLDKLEKSIIAAVDEDDR